jgi:hypothetical protein
MQTEATKFTYHILKMPLTFLLSWEFPQICQTKQSLKVVLITQLKEFP